MDHLLLGYAFAKQVWFALLQPLQLATLMPEHDADIASWCLRQHSRVDSKDRPMFDSLLLLVTWSLWKERNTMVFGRPTSDALAIIRTMLHEGKEWALGGFMPFVALTKLWSQHQGEM